MNSQTITITSSNTRKLVRIEKMHNKRRGKEGNDMRKKRFTKKTLNYNYTPKKRNKKKK